MANKKMGFEGKAYYGTAGSTASTELANTRDIKVPIKLEKGETTVRGTSGVPKKSSRATCVDMDGIEITMVNHVGDASLEAMKQAAASGDPIALRLKDYSSGKGFDGDVIVEVDKEWPLKGEQLIRFSCAPNDDNRDWSAYV